jgi:P-type conjugative transfer protein TrbJ
MRKQVCRLVFVFLAFAPLFEVQTYGGIPIGIPSQEITQIMIHVQQALQYERQAEQVYYELQMLRDMAQQARHLADIPRLSEALLSDIGDIRNIIKETQGLSYGFAANDANFRNTYNVYAQNTKPFYAQYTDWAGATLNTALAAARAAGVQQDQVWSEQKTNAALQAMMSTTQGREQALEIANSLSFTMVGQMQKLRSLMATDMLSKASFSGYQIARDQASETDTSAATAYVERPPDHSQYGNVPSSAH